MKSSMKFGIGTLLVAMLLVSMALMPAVSAKKNIEEGDVGILSIDVDGGTLIIDETNGITAIASAGSYTGPYIPGLTYKLWVYYTYEDTADVALGTAHFKLTAPDGTVDEISIFDEPIIDNDANGYLSVTFQPNGPGTYHWTIECSEKGVSDSDVGDLILT